MYRRGRRNGVRVNSTDRIHAEMLDRSEHEADEVVMTLLHDHVPLALICDLTNLRGPSSARILAEEGQPDSAWWVQ
jgi:hypothetical protein